MTARRLRVAVLGAGTVGREVVRAFEVFPERLSPPRLPALRLVGVAVRDVARAKAAGIAPELLTDAPAHLVASPETDVIVELMGGDEPARTLIAAALGAGKPVVTANKHVIAHHGPELEAIARRAGVALRFEAAVAGGVPILGPLGADLAANRVTQVRGIVNGSTNYVLSAMATGARAYPDVLAEAQAAGYLEADPAADVEGTDAANKLAILIRLAFGVWVEPESIVRRPPTAGGSGEAWDGPPGITAVRAVDVAAAGAFGLAIKLVAGARRLDDGRIAAAVVPTGVSLDDPLGRTDGVTNRVEIRAEPVGDIAASGPGAGGPATSSAVLGDLLAVARGEGSTWAGLPPASAARAGTLVAPPGAEGGWLAVLPGAWRSSILPAGIGRTAPIEGGVAMWVPRVGLAEMRALVRAGASEASDTAGGAALADIPIFPVDEPAAR